MRFLCSLTILACLGIATNVLAQDPFQGVPVEPRPSEYIHWDAGAFTELQSQLEQELRDGSRIWGTRFVYTSALPRADHRHHDVQIIHRSGYTQPEIHATKWDIYVILDGSGTLSANVRETRSTQRIRVGRRQRNRTCWDCEREWKRMVVPLEPGRPSEARQLLRTRR